MILNGSHVVSSGFFFNGLGSFDLGSEGLLDSVDGVASCLVCMFSYTITVESDLMDW